MGPAQKSLGKYQELVYDAVSQPSVSGPNDAVAEEIINQLRWHSRSIGHIAMDPEADRGQGLANALVLGMMDAGLTFDRLVELAVMHGDLPILEEWEPDSGVQLLLKKGGAWAVQAAPTTPTT